MLWTVTPLWSISSSDLYTAFPWAVWELITWKGTSLDKGIPSNWLLKGSLPSRNLKQCPFNTAHASTKRTSLRSKSVNTTVLYPTSHSCPQTDVCLATARVSPLLPVVFPPLDHIRVTSWPAKVLPELQMIHKQHLWAKTDECCDLNALSKFHLSLQVKKGKNSTLHSLTPPGISLSEKTLIWHTQAFVPSELSLSAKRQGGHLHCNFLCLTLQVRLNKHFASAMPVRFPTQQKRTLLFSRPWTALKHLKPGEIKQFLHLSTGV